MGNKAQAVAEAGAAQEHEQAAFIAASHPKAGGINLAVLLGPVEDGVAKVKYHSLYDKTEKVGDKLVLAVRPKAEADEIYAKIKEALAAREKKLAPEEEAVKAARAAYTEAQKKYFEAFTAASVDYRTAVVGLLPELAKASADDGYADGGQPEDPEDGGEEENG